MMVFFNQTHIHVNNPMRKNTNQILEIQLAICSKVSQFQLRVTLDSVLEGLICLNFCLHCQTWPTFLLWQLLSARFCQQGTLERDKEGTCSFLSTSYFLSASFMVALPFGNGCCNELPPFTQLPEPASSGPSEYSLQKCSLTSQSQTLVPQTLFLPLFPEP